MDADKRDTILESAGAVFAQHGFKKTSIDDIAKRAGVAKGTVYLASPSKKDLFYEVLLRELREWNGEVAKHIDPRTPADELLLACAERGVRSLDDRPLVRGLLLGEMDHLLPELRPRFAELRAVGVTFILEILRLGQRQGLFRKDLDIDEIANLLLDLQTATLLFHLHPEDPELEMKLMRRGIAARDLIMHGLRPHASASSTDPT
jgi:TetR/AcrR family transcriptional repressor of uid operon